MIGPSAAHPCPHWPLELPDYRGCFTCPLLDCMYDSPPLLTRGRQVTVAGILGRELARLAVPYRQIVALTLLSRTHIFRLRQREMTRPVS